WDRSRRNSWRSILEHSTRSCPRRRTTSSTSAASALRSPMEGSRFSPILGSVAAQLLAQHFGTLDAILPASADDILNVRGIGSTIADGVVAFFSDPAGRALVE